MTLDGRAGSTGPVLGATLRCVTSPVGSVAAASAAATSRIDWKRSSGSFSRQRRTTYSSAGGNSRPGAESGGVSSRMIACIVSTAEPRRNAARPLSIS